MGLYWDALKATGRKAFSEVADYMNRKGEEFYNMHYNNVNNFGTGFEGTYNISEAINGNDQPLQDSKQDALDGYNQSKGAPTFAELIHRYQSGEITALELQAIVAEYNMKLNPYQELWLNNIINQESTQSDRDFQTEQRDTSLISTYEQLQKLGLNPGSVIQLGGSSSGVSSSAAAPSRSSIENARFDRQTQMAQTMIRLAGGLASTGVHGAALGAARFAASKLTSEASRYATDMKYSHMKTRQYNPNLNYYTDFYGSL